MRVAATEGAASGAGQGGGARRRGPAAVLLDGRGASRARLRVVAHPRGALHLLHDPGAVLLAQRVPARRVRMPPARRQVGARRQPVPRLLALGAKGKGALAAEGEAPPLLLQGGGVLAARAPDDVLARRRSARVREPGGRLRDLLLIWCRKGAGGGGGGGGGEGGGGGGGGGGRRGRQGRRAPSWWLARSAARAAPTWRRARRGGTPAPRPETPRPGTRARGSAARPPHPRPSAKRSSRSRSPGKTCAGSARTCGVHGGARAVNRAHRAGGRAVWRCGPRRAPTARSRRWPGPRSRLHRCASPPPTPAGGGGAAR